MPYSNVQVATMPMRKGMIASQTMSGTLVEPGGSKRAFTLMSCWRATP